MNCLKNSWTWKDRLYQRIKMLFAKCADGNRKSPFAQDFCYNGMRKGRNPESGDFVLERVEREGNDWMKNRNLRCVGSAIAALILAELLSGCGHSMEMSPLPSEADLVVCTDLDRSVYEPVVKEFEERTGLFVKVLDGTTEEIRTRFSQTEDGVGSDLAAQADWDLAFGVSTEILDAYPNLWTSCESTQEYAIADKFRSQDHRWTAFSVLPLVIMYNTNVVTYREVPSGWESLLEPRWQGRVALADPKLSDVSQAALAAAMLTTPEGEDYPKELAFNLNDETLDSLARVNEGILDGRYCVGVTTEDAAQELRSSGADIDPENGTLAVLEGTAVRAGCEHEKTAAQFLNFTAGKEAQKILSVSRSRRSVRMDVAAEKGMDSFDRLPFLNADRECVSAEKKKALAAWEKVFCGKIRAAAGTGQQNEISETGGAS